ncbi:MAG: aspartate-semialdehyde dehydrogenase, partial [Chitinophagaceae bacterium]
MKVAVVGSTGLVGSKILQILEERNFPLTELYPVATEKSVGKKVLYKGEKYKVMSYQEALGKKPQLAIFSAGAATSLKLAPLFAKVGCKVIDNSSAWRMDTTKKLIVPEVNAELIQKEDMIIANPNCSTIQMVVVLNPLHKRYKIKRVVVSTYQSVTGTGKKAVDQLLAERKYLSADKIYPYPIDLNIIPHIDVFLDNGYTNEEEKMIRETCKIMADDSIKVTATTVRVPVIGGHSESLNIEFEQDFDLKEVREILSKTEGVVVEDN